MGKDLDIVYAVSLIVAHFTVHLMDTPASAKLLLLWMAPAVHRDDGVSVVNAWMMEPRKSMEVGVHGNGWGARGHVAEEYSGGKEHAQSQSQQMVASNVMEILKVFIESVDRNLALPTLPTIAQNNAERSILSISRFSTEEEKMHAICIAVSKIIILPRDGQRMERNASQMVEQMFALVESACL